MKRSGDGLLDIKPATFAQATIVLISVVYELTCCEGIYYACSLFLPLSVNTSWTAFCSQVYKLLYPVYTVINDVNSEMNRNVFAIIKGIINVDGGKWTAAAGPSV